MAFNRVIPSQHLLPAQVKSVTLREIRPPYNSEMGSEIGTFYLVRARPPAHHSPHSMPGPCLLSLAAQDGLWLHGSACACLCAGQMPVQLKHLKHSWVLCSHGASGQADRLALLFTGVCSSS